MIQLTTVDESAGVFLTPELLANRWHQHPESIRRTLRQRRLASVVVGRRRLIPMAEILRVENSGLITKKVF